jgi:hypothetical protein
MTWQGETDGRLENTMTGASLRVPEPLLMSLAEIRRLRLRPVSVFEAAPLMDLLIAQRRFPFDLQLGYPGATVSPGAWGRDGLLPVYSRALRAAFLVAKVFAGRNWLGKTNIEYGTFCAYEGLGGYSFAQSRQCVADAVATGMSFLNQMASVPEHSSSRPAASAPVAA